MIVTCTSCQTRFRIPDEKIGPRGARVRCSRCKNVFVAKPAPVEQAAPPDPFAVPAGDPFAASRAAQADPFAAAQPAPADPFATAAGDPFAAAPPPAEPAGGLPLAVTDLADLAAPGRAAAPATRGGLTALAPPMPATPAPAAAADAGQVTSADDLVLEEPSQAISMAQPSLPSAAPTVEFEEAGQGTEPVPGEGGGQAPPFDFGVPGIDLGEPPGAEPASGLEMDSPAGGMPGGADFAGADPFASAAPADSAAGADLMEIAARPRTITEPIPQAKAPPAPAGPSAAERRKAAAALGAGPLSGPPPSGRLRSAAASAVSLAALLAVAGGLLFWWLRDSAGPGRGAGRLVAVVEATGGLYETPAGRPVLFVRGRVESRSAAPLGRVVVRVEVLRGGEVLARAEERAGAVPTPEEVAQLASRVDAERLRIQAAARAPAQLAPGGALPFLVIFDEVPEGLRDAALRVVAAPEASAPARAP